MIREQFVKYFEVLQEHLNQQLAIGDALGVHLLDRTAVVTFGDNLAGCYIELLAENSPVSEDAISALLYEGPSMHYYGEEKNGHYAVEVNVVTAEDLWDFYQLCDEYDQNKREYEVLLYDKPVK